MADKTSVNQIQALLTGLNRIQQISIAVAAITVAGGIAILTHFRTESDFRPLYTAMAPEDAAPVVQKLRESGVEYRLTDGGGTVLVPSAKLAESRLTLAGAGLPKSGRVGFEIFDKTNFGATELVEHINFQRALEGELERSVMSMAEVVQARVHLSLPKDSVFLDQRQPAKASVMVRLRPGAHISQQGVVAVTNLVASAVDGLSPEAVAVIDVDGNLLSRPRSTANDDSQVTSEALEVRQQIEHDLVAKMSSTLEPLVGSNNFRAGASVECDLTSGEQQEETFDPDKSVMVSSQKTEEDSRKGSAGGVPGTAANLPQPPAQTGNATGSSHRTESVTYQTSRVVKHTRIPQGVVKRMSLSVLVGQQTHWEGQGKARHRVVVPPSPDTLKTIHDLIAGVTGFNSDRGDQLIVETLPFEPALDGDPAKLISGVEPKTATPTWLEMVQKYRDPALIVMAGLAVLMVVLRTSAKMALNRNAALENAEMQSVPAVGAGAVYQPIPSADRAEISQPALHDFLSAAQEGTAQRIKDLAQKDINATANVLRMWMQNQKA